MSWPWALLAFLLLALLLFWAVGAHKRLRQLRLAAHQAWQKVQQANGQRSVALRPLLAALREPLASETQTLDQCLAALERVDASFAAMNLQPLEPLLASQCSAAESSFSASASRISALLEQHPELCAQEPWQQLRADWDQAQSRWPFVRQLFGEAVSAYNSALTEFPTRWLSGLFRFRPAASI